MLPKRISLLMKSFARAWGEASSRTLAASVRAAHGHPPCSGTNAVRPRSLFSGILCGWWALLLTLPFLYPVSVAYGQELEAGLQVEVGIENVCKTGCWTEARVTSRQLPAGIYLAEVAVLDADGNTVTYQSRVQTSSDVGTLTFRIPVRFLRTGSDLVARLYSLNDQAEADIRATQAFHQAPGTLLQQARMAPRELRQLTQYEPWIVGLGHVESLELTADFVRDLQVTQVDQIEQLPRDFLCWQGIDAIFWAADQIVEEDLSRLARWVHGGGKLILFPNQPAEQFLQLPIVAQLPITFDGVAQVRDLSRLVSFVGEPSPLRITTMTLPRIDAVTGRTLVGGLNGPVVTVSPWGLGELTVLTVQLNESVFQSWEALPQLYRLLANLPLIGTGETETSSSLLSQNGLTDMKTQWDAGLSDFGVVATNIWLPLAGLLLAALLVGPIDFLLVRHLLQRPSLTWLTFPLLVIGVCLWGLSSGSDTSVRGVMRQQLTPADAAHPFASGVLGNQTVVIDYAPQTGTQRVAGFTKLLVEQTGRYNIASQWEVPVEQIGENVLFGPGAIPEASFRGYYRTSATHLDQTSYRLQPREMSVSGLPIYEGSTALLEVLGQQQIPQVETNPVVTSQLRGTSTNQLRGSFSHHLSEPIADWVIAYGKILYFVSGDHSTAELSPGEVLQIPSAEVNQKELTALLTGTTTQMVKRKTGVGEDLLVKRISYNPFATDLSFILNRLTFHRLLGGKSYTSLTNIELAHWDLTEQLELNQAVLVGKLKTPQISTTVDSVPVKTIKNETFVRIVIPVELPGQAPTRLPEFDKTKRQ